VLCTAVIEGYTSVPVQQFLSELNWCCVNVADAGPRCQC